MVSRSDGRTDQIQCLYDMHAICMLNINEALCMNIFEILSFTYKAIQCLFFTIMLIAHWLDEFSLEIPDIYLEYEPPKSCLF